MEVSGKAKPKKNLGAHGPPGNIYLNGILVAEFVNQVIVIQESALTTVDKFGLVKLCFQEGSGDIRRGVEQYAHG